MRYIINENNNGIPKALDDQVLRSLLESMGYIMPEEETEESTAFLSEGMELEDEYDCDTYSMLFEHNQEVFAVLEDVYEFENELFVEAVALEDEADVLRESNGDEFEDSVIFGDGEYLLEGIYELDGYENFFIRLEEARGPVESDPDYDPTSGAMANDGTTKKKSNADIKKAVKKSGGADAGGEPNLPSATRSRAGRSAQPYEKRRKR